jgi:diguanylate cyclase (GGDEF)-like protein
MLTLSRIDTGQGLGLVGMVQDVTDRRRLEAELAHRAFHDPLTGLANRALFADRVAHALARAGRQPETAAVLYVDLDDFKGVNDTLGHAAGDALLAVVAARLLNATRGCDTVARLGGDEFAVLLENVRDEADATTVAERVLAAVSTPAAVGGRLVGPRASVGIARAAPGTSAEELLRDADTAMYDAKARGAGGLVHFAPAMREAVVTQRALEADLRAAADAGEFRLAYQPIVALDDGAGGSAAGGACVAGVEALLRWTHPARGAIPPAEFIPIAERTGAIMAVGRWVLEAACREAAGWRARGGAPAPSVTVNVSARQLDDAGLVDDVRSALAAAGLPAARLVLEITESALMQNTELTLARLHALKSLGVQLAVDDFGTGYSSLAYLQRFPVDVLKIDKSFVDGVALGGPDAALARTIVALGQMLGLRTVAEGVEDAAQRDHLRALGCGYAQGYLFARPLAPDALAALLSAADCAPPSPGAASPAPPPRHRSLQ